MYEHTDFVVRTHLRTNINTAYDRQTVWTEGDRQIRSLGVDREELGCGQTETSVCLTYYSPGWSRRWTSPPPHLPPHARYCSALLLLLTSARSMNSLSWMPSVRSSCRMSCTRRLSSGQAATFSHSHTLLHHHTHLGFVFGCVQADGGRPPPTLGEEGLLPDPKCSAAPGAG